jgi:hypothetical protein
MVKYELCRFEKKSAILRVQGIEASEIKVPHQQLPRSSKEGDILSISFLKGGIVRNAVVLKSDTTKAHNQN